MRVKEGYKHTELGFFPADWDIIEIGDQVNLLTGFPFPSKGYSQTGVKLLRGSNIKRGASDWSPHITQYWPEIPTKLKQYLLEEGDIVIAMDGSLVGRSFTQLTSTDLPALLLQRVARIRAQKIDIGYLKEFICSEYFTKHCNTVKTVTAIPHISPKDIKCYKIPLPPTINEQNSIATALSDADELIQSLGKLIAKKRAIKQGAMQGLFKPKEGWVEKKLGDIGTFSKGSGIKKDESQSGDLPCVRYGEIYTLHNDYIKKFYSFISYEVTKTSKKLKSGDLLFAGSGETKGEIGKCVAFIQNEEAYVGGDIVILSPKNVDTLFLGYYLNTPEIVKQKTSKGQGDAVVHISAHQLQHITIYLPLLVEQRRIATIISEMDAEIFALESKLAKYKQIKQGMMQNLLTGRIRLV